MAREWRLILSGPCSPPLNMAIDEAMLLRLIEKNSLTPTLRLYMWSPPALSVGYFQNVNSPPIKECLKKGYPLIRRPTGGLAILHEDDMSYSITGIFAGDGFPANRREAYRKAHESIIEAFVDLGFKVDLYQEEKLQYEGDFCCSSPLVYDIILEGEGKIGGSAQRKRGDALLQHGSISLPKGIDQNQLKKKVVESFEKLFQVKLKSQNLTQEELSLSEKLVKEKYGTREWNYKR